MTKNNPPILLTDAFPDWMTGDGIFSEMVNPPWAGVVNADLLDLDYFGNHSGWKKGAPLVYRLLNDDNELTEASRIKLAALVMAKFGPNWSALWATYHTEYNPFEDYSITETGESEGANAKTRQNTHTGSETVSDDSELTHGHQIGTSFSTTQDEDTDLVHGQVVAVEEENNATTTQSKWGFNTAETPVPTDKADGEGTNSSTTTNSGTDSTERDFSETKSGTETHSGKDSSERDISKSENASDNGSESGTESASYEKHFSGLKGNFTKQQLIEQERALWLEDYFARVFMDVDSVLASMIYNREHRFNPYYPTGFGYYSI